jgi:zinc transport system ATP-binding protein
MGKCLLEIKNLHFSYKGSEAILNNISFSLHSGEVLGIIGPNGGGKTTLLKIILGLLPMNSGDYYIDGKKISGKLPYQMFGHVPQSKELNTLLPLTCYELLKLESTDCSRIDLMIEKYSLSKFIHQPLSKVSGGQLQRTLMARALLKKPAILVLDEPSTGLDTQGIDQVGAMIDYIKQQNEQSIIIVDHNIKQILSYADKILCLNKTHHWHDRKTNLTQHVLNSIYHCEYEHELIHEKVDSTADQHTCCHIHPAKGNE